MMLRTLALLSLFLAVSGCHCSKCPPDRMVSAQTFKKVSEPFSFKVTPHIPTGFVSSMKR